MLQFILFIQLVILAHSHATETLQAFIHDNTHFTHLQFNFTHTLEGVNIYLPHFFIKSLQEANVSHLQILLGYNQLPKLIQQNYPKKGIKVISKADLNQKKLFYFLNGALGISRRSEKYMIPFGYNNSSYKYFSDPNDELCTQTVQEIIKIMPCQTYTGIVSIINTKILFKNLYVGIKLQFYLHQNHLISTVDIWIQNNPKDPFQNIMKNRLSKCQIYNQSIVNIGQESISLTRKPIHYLEKLYDFKTLESKYPTLSQTKSINARWYGFKGVMSHKLQFNNYKGKLIMYTYFEKQFYPIKDSIQFYISKKLVQRSQYSITIRTFTDYIILEIIIQNQILNSIHLILHYTKFFKSFQKYETIGKGGQQWMPTLIILKNQHNQQLFFSQNVFDRLPEPDFSIPFQVITFTMVFGGYFWISIWRNYIRILQNDSKQYKEAKQ